VLYLRLVTYVDVIEAVVLPPCLQIGEVEIVGTGVVVCGLPAQSRCCLFGTASLLVCWQRYAHIFHIGSGPAPIVPVRNHLNTHAETILNPSSARTCEAKLPWVFTTLIVYLVLIHNPGDNMQTSHLEDGGHQGLQP
jgi:hypothetical protein